MARKRDLIDDEAAADSAAGLTPRPQRRRIRQGSAASSSESGGSGGEDSDASQNSHQQRQRRELTLFQLLGLYEVIPKELSLLFDPEEFVNVLYSSADNTDADDEERYFNCSGSLTSSSSKGCFLQHRTGRVTERYWEDCARDAGRVPSSTATLCDGVIPSPHRRLQCADELRRSIERVHFAWGGAVRERVHLKPRVLQPFGLPMYESRAKLELVLYATLDTELYGFTTA